MRSKEDIKTEENRLNANLKKINQDKNYYYKMYSYAKHSYAIGFYEIMQCPVCNGVGKLAVETK